MGRNNNITSIVLHMYSDLPSETRPGWVDGGPQFYSEVLINDFVTNICAKLRSSNRSDIDVIQIDKFNVDITFNDNLLQVRLDETPWPFLNEDYSRIFLSTGSYNWYYHHIDVGEHSFTNTGDALSYFKHLLDHNMQPADKTYVDENFRENQAEFSKDLASELGGRLKEIEKGRMRAQDLYHPLRRVTIDNQEVIMRRSDFLKLVQEYNLSI